MLSEKFDESKAILDFTTTTTSDTSSFEPV